MNYELCISQILDTTLVFKYAFGQFILFIVGMCFSVVLGLWLLPYVYTFEDLIWYICSMLVPLLPFMTGMERCKL